LPPTGLLGDVVLAADPKVAAMGGGRLRITLRAWRAKDDDDDDDEDGDDDDE